MGENFRFKDVFVLRKTTKDIREKFHWEGGINSLKEPTVKAATGSIRMVEMVWKKWDIIFFFKKFWDRIHHNTKQSN